MSGARVAVIQFPGVNCEAETVRALERAGLGASVFRWTRPAGELRSFEAYVLPGGFSYQDRVRAGVLAAKDPLVGVLAERAEAGRPVLGICNGAQVLVEAGLVPGGGAVEVALAANRMPARSGYYTRWVTCRVEASPCLFLRHLEPGTLLPLPVAHGEGRFVVRDSAVGERMREAGQFALRYVNPAGGPADYPWNPNGSPDGVAGVSDPTGRVLGLMPHPERNVEAWHHPRWTRGEGGDATGGLAIFRNAVRAAAKT